MQGKDDDSGGVRYLRTGASPFSLPARTPSGTLIQGGSTPVPPSTPATVRGLVPGQVLSGRYQVDRWLGAGGSATVYAAMDLKTGAHVALKLLPAAPHDASMVARFRQELEHARVLEHPNVLRVLDVGTDEDRHFLISELFQGMDLRRLLQMRRRHADRVPALAHPRGVRAGARARARRAAPGREAGQPLHHPHREC